MPWIMYCLCYGTNPELVTVVNHHESISRPTLSIFEGSHQVCPGTSIVMQVTWTQLVLIFVPLYLAWLIIEAIRRLFLSSIAHVPGPKWAALTSWYEFYYDVIKPGQYVWKIKALHAQYGWSAVISWSFI